MSYKSQLSQLFVRKKPLKTIVLQKLSMFKLSLFWLKIMEFLLKNIRNIYFLKIMTKMLEFWIR